MPEISTYCDYSSGNYGVNALCVTLGSLEVYFSYKTPVAFNDGSGIVCRVNDWKQTTGKHLNAIQPDKSKRIPGDEFENKLAEVLKAHGLDPAQAYEMTA